MNTNTHDFNPFNSWRIQRGCSINDVLGIPTPNIIPEKDITDQVEIIEQKLLPEPA